MIIGRKPTKQHREGHAVAVVVFGRDIADRIYPDCAEFPPRIGVLFRLGSLWVGVHYSSANRRFCINFVPCVTVWITLRGGIAP